MEIIYRGVGKADRVAVFPGAYNPPTTAHVAIARAALRWSREVVWVLPRSFPHKSFEGANPGERRAMLTVLAQRNAGFSLAISDGGLYSEIAEEARQCYGDTVEIGLLCGRDAADRIANWDYGAPGVFDELVGEYQLLVASREGHYQPAEHHRDRVVPLTLEASLNEVSSSEVRRRIAEGRPWTHLVPAEICGMVRDFYRRID